MKKYLITSALPYANGHIHLGHAAGAYLPADIFVRFLRLSGEQVLYVCGSDEHGVAIKISAEKEKVTPKEIIDKYHNSNKDAFDKLGMSFDIYSRTSLPSHHVIAREFFRDFLNKGYLIEKEEEQFYDTEAKMFLPDRYVEGTCPNCDNDKARGDQCDSCGAYYNQTELKNPISTISGKTPIVKRTTHWYMQFQKFQEFLEGFIESNKDDWKENVLQQTRSWLKQGLTERAMTRDLDWGVNITDIKGIDNLKAEGKVLYVWFDAVLGYISATKVWAEMNNQNWKDWWQNENTDYIAFIGKDNIVFHTLIFPVLLHGKGDYILPKNVPANEFLNLEGKKFSKSRNWSIDLKDFFERHNSVNLTDTLRYTLATNFPETSDADFKWKDFQAKSNNELAAILGNFINRTIQFLHKNFEGKVPNLVGKFAEFKNDWISFLDGKEVNIKEKYSENDELLLNTLKSELEKTTVFYKRYRFRDAMNCSMNIARAANKYFNDEEPWKAIKSDSEKAAKTLYVCCQLVNTLAYVFAPILPHTSEIIFKTLNVDVQTGAVNKNYTEDRIDRWNKSIYPQLSENHQIGKPEILFSRIEDSFVEEEMSKLGDKKETQGPSEKEMITIDDFKKVQLRTAEIIKAENIKKSNKLLKLQVDIAGEKRQILAGVAKFYKPEELIGKTIVVVYNLKPAKLMGQESQGMMLAANDDEGNLCFVTPEKNIKSGAEVR